MKPRTRARTPSSIASNQSSKSKPSAATAASFVVSLVMAWSPFQRANAGIIWVEQPGDYANPIPTTAATGPADLAEVIADHSINTIVSRMRGHFEADRSVLERTVHWE